MYSEEQLNAVINEIINETINDDVYLKDMQIYLNPKNIIKSIPISRNVIEEILEKLENNQKAIQILDRPQPYGNMDEDGNYDSSKPFKIAYDCYLIKIEEKLFQLNVSIPKKKVIKKEIKIKREAEINYKGYKVFNDETIEYEGEEIKLTGQKLFILKSIIMKSEPGVYNKIEKQEIMSLLTDSSGKTYKAEMKSETITKYICTIRNELVRVIEKVIGEKPKDILQSMDEGYRLKIIP